MRGTLLGEKRSLDTKKLWKQFLIVSKSAAWQTPHFLQLETWPEKRGVSGHHLSPECKIKYLLFHVLTLLRRFVSNVSKSSYSVYDHQTRCNATTVQNASSIGKPWICFPGDSAPNSVLTIHRSEFNIHRTSHSDRQREIRDPSTEIGAFIQSCPSAGPRKSVLQASTLLSQWRDFGSDGMNRLKISGVVNLLTNKKGNLE